MPQNLTEKDSVVGSLERPLWSAGSSSNWSVERSATRLFNRALLMTFILALGMRLVYLDVARQGPLGNPDSEAYQALAEGIQNRQPYSTGFAGGPGGFPADLQRPPGYPVFLSAINLGSGVSRVWTGFIQSVLGAMFAVTLALAMRQLAGALIGLLAGLFYALDWVTILHTPLLTAETTYSIALTLAVCACALYLTKRRLYLAIVGGVLMGIAALIKPAAQVVLFAPLIILLLQRNRRWAGALFVAAYVVCVAPWMIRNYEKHGVFALSAISTAAIYFYTAQGATGDYSWQEMTAKVNELDVQWSTQSLTPPDRKRIMEEEAWSEIKLHWPMVLKQAAIGFIRTCVGTGRETLFVALGGDHRQNWLWSTSLPLSQVLGMWAFALIGLVTARRSPSVPRSVVFLFIGTVLLVLMPAASPLGYSRYRVPAVPMLCVLAALGAGPILLWIERLSLFRRVQPSNLASEFVGNEKERSSNG